MLEIEDLFSGGWTLKRGPRVRVGKNVAQDQEASLRPVTPGRRPSPTPQYRMDRFVRIAEPRPAPRPLSTVRHHHFEQKVILASAKGTVSVAERRAAYGEGFNATDSLLTAEVRATNEAAYTEGHKSTEAERVVYVTSTNGKTYEERMRFWDLANEHAHFVGDHKITRVIGVPLIMSTNMPHHPLQIGESCGNQFLCHKARSPARRRGSSSASFQRSIK